MRFTNDAVVNGKGTIAGGTAAAAGAATTLQFDRSVAPPNARGMCHVTMTVSLPGMVTATTEKGGPGGTSGIEGVGVGDTLRERHTSNMQKEEAETRANKKSEHCYSKQYGSLHTWKQARTTSISKSKRCNIDTAHTDIVTARVPSSTIIVHSAVRTSQTSTV